VNRFCRYELRTTDADAAREFYQRILGHDRAVIWPLHEQARARGARPHWLGHVRVEDAEGAATAFAERGATRLGATFGTRDGAETAILRDPGGAVLAVTSQPQGQAGSGPEVIWHVLNTNDAARAATNYADLFGLQLTGPIEVEGDGVFQQFAWHAGGETVGVIGDIAARPGVHPHWLFFFSVNALDSRIAAVREAGGIVAESTTLPTGQRVCVCDDPQGAAFALCEA
jgi:uncharacterized protein